MKGIILAGGTGTRLFPLRSGVEASHLDLRQADDLLSAVYPHADRIRDILVITAPNDAAAFGRLLGDGARFSINIAYAVQDSPRGLADAIIIGREFVGRDRVVLILGENIFYGQGLRELLMHAAQREAGATVFSYVVADPARFESLMEASAFVRTLQHRQGLNICCPEEIAARLGFISLEQLLVSARKFENSEYGRYLL
jgi:glucose-1-phosphate thymidylyltransferase